jgi:hypothetical protein
MEKYATTPVLSGDAIEENSSTLMGNDILHLSPGVNQSALLASDRAFSTQ